jgi:hypothetical protein
LDFPYKDMAHNSTVFQRVVFCYFSTAPTFGNLARHIVNLTAVSLMVVSLWNVTLCQ